MQKQATKPAETTEAKAQTEAKAEPKAKPETKAKPKAETEAKTEKQLFNAQRDAGTIAADRTAYAKLSDRDIAYLRLYGDAMRANGHAATIAGIANAGKQSGGKIINPYYAGSAKATDAGAANRLRKAGFITIDATGNKIKATALAKKTAAYLGK